MWCAGGEVVWGGGNSVGRCEKGEGSYEVVTLVWDR